MNLDNNIKNSFEVVRKTYENLYKLMTYLDSESVKKGYIRSIERFLRYSSDSDYNGWLYNNLVKLYQSNKDEESDSRWYKGPIYAVEFSFVNMPKMIVSKYDFNINEWNSGIGANRVNYFSNPVNTNLTNEFRHEKIEGFTDYKKAVPLNDEIFKSYWDLNYVVFKEFNLIDINLENASKLVFDEFDKMKDLK